MNDKERAFLEGAQAVLEAIANSHKDKVFGGSIGSGGHARKFNAGNTSCHKLVIPGDRKGTVVTQLQWLLGDLAVDLGLPEEVREKVYGVVK